MKWQEDIQKSKTFYDTVDFEEFFPKDTEVEVRDIMDIIDNFYYTHPWLLPDFFDGEFFNFIDELEFADYLNNRYGWKTHEEVTTRTYIKRP